MTCSIGPFSIDGSGECSTSATKYMLSPLLRAAQRLLVLYHAELKAMTLADKSQGGLHAQQTHTHHTAVRILFLRCWWSLTQIRHDDYLPVCFFEGIFIVAGWRFIRIRDALFFVRAGLVAVCEE